MIGIYRIVKKQMAFDLGYSIESVNSLMDRFINSYKLITYNSDTRELCIRNYGKYNLNKAGKPVTDCIKKELNEVKDKSLILEMVSNVKHEGNRKIIMEYLNTIGIPYGNDTSSGTYKELKNDTENNKNDKNGSITEFERYVNDTFDDRGQTKNKTITKNKTKNKTITITKI